MKITRLLLNLSKPTNQYRKSIMYLSLITKKLEMKLKKNTMAFSAALLWAVGAHAQSSVGIYGILDSGITYVNNQGGKSNVYQDPGVMQANRWGLRGTEDLGGGYKTIFRLENGFTINDGKLGQGGAMFGRLAYVGIASPWGTVTLGRQYDFMADLTVYTAAATVATAYAFHRMDADRTAAEQLNNSVKFVSADFHGLDAGAMYSFSNVAGSFGGTPGNPRAVSFGAHYTNGSFSTVVAYTNINGAGGSIAEVYLGGNAQRIFGLGMKYNFGSDLVFANATSTRISNQRGGGSPIINNYEAGGVYFIRPAINVGGGYTLTTWSGVKYSQFNLGAHYLLSKRTDLYASVNYQHASSADAVAGMFLIVSPGTFQGFSSTQNQVALHAGIRHFF